MKSEKQILEKIEELKKRRDRLDPEDGLDYSEWLRTRAKIAILKWSIDGMSEDVD